MVKWHIRQPLQFDGPSRPSLLYGIHAGTDLVCTSYVMGIGIVCVCEGRVCVCQEEKRGGEGGALDCVVRLGWQCDVSL